MSEHKVPGTSMRKPSPGAVGPLRPCHEPGPAPAKIPAGPPPPGPTMPISGGKRSESS